MSHFHRSLPVGAHADDGERTLAPPEIARKLPVCPILEKPSRRTRQLNQNAVDQEFTATAQLDPIVQADHEPNAIFAHCFLLNSRWLV